ncbi:hypothetical protein [Billgrantia ethanolica]|uniref:Uncharacterized protein n=1 Tax=Billgrantia ethanolica TaxID=2733486 RepID=A0ABS9A9D1_9GAMM|nr:hypothetical protein [Halomonas ethanolica]MCE8004650.1 hypothetical protein [Halomonas ethanolica]
MGQHRYAVISALGQERIPIRVEQFVRRQEVMLWPGVASGLFTPSAALKVFDACFIDEAQPPASTMTAGSGAREQHQGEPHEELEASSEQVGPGTPG